MPDRTKVRARVFVSGIVQGVYFRQNTKEVALKNLVSGWVRNLPDGRVEGLFEGDRENVSRVIEWCHVGPAKARVEKVELAFESYKGEFPDFTIDQ